MMALFLRDLKLSVRAGGGALIGVLFFMTVVAVIPFGVGPDLNLLSRIGPAIVWIGALLSALLGLDRLFQAERARRFTGSDADAGVPACGDGLRQVVWRTGLRRACRVVIASPLLGLFMNMNEIAIGAVMLTLLVGSPAIHVHRCGRCGRAVALPRGGLLVSIPRAAARHSRSDPSASVHLTLRPRIPPHLCRPFCF